MVVFVSSPYKAVLDSIKDENEAMAMITHLALSGCNVVKEMGYIPLSPVLALSGVYDESCNRNTALKASLEFLKASEAIYIVQSEYNKHSQGMILEKELAKTLGKIIYEESKNEN